MRSTLLALALIPLGCTFQAGTSFPGRPAPPPTAAAPPPGAAAPAAPAGSAAAGAPAASAAPAATADADAPANHVAGPPPWNDKPARYSREYDDASAPGGRLHGNDWDCDAHDQCIHPASWFLVSTEPTRAGFGQVSFEVEGMFFDFFSTQRMRGYTAHKTRRARAAEVVIGARVFVFDGNAPKPKSWYEATRWAWIYGVIDEVGDGWFRIERKDKRFPIDQARVTIETRVVE